MTLPDLAPPDRRSAPWWGVSAIGYVLVIGGTGASLPLLLLAGAAALWLLAHRAFGTWRPGEILADGVLRSFPFGVALLAVALHMALLVEQLARLGMWLRSPAAAPFMTSWSADAANRVQLLVPGGAGLGGWVVDLVAAATVLAGIGLLVRLSASRGGPGHHLRRARFVQRVLVADLCLVTLTVVLLGRPIGVLTAFGLVSSFAVATGLRIVGQLVLTAVVARHALGAVREGRDAGLAGLAPAVLEGSLGVAPTVPGAAGPG